MSDFAAALGVGSIACHVGFVPHDRDDANYIAVRGMVRSVCDHAATNGQTFALETGQVTSLDDCDGSYGACDWCYRANHRRTV